MALSLCPCAQSDAQHANLIISASTAICKTFFLKRSPASSCPPLTPAPLPQEEGCAGCGGEGVGEGMRVMKRHAV
jgi:hypothetical protein